MMKGRLSTGFEFQVDEKNLDNMEMVEAIAECDTNPIAMTHVIKMLLGEEQKKRLYDHLRTEDGRVPIKAVSTAVVEIFNSAKKGKNS